MKKLLLIWCLLMAVAGLQAQKLTVDKMEVAEGDLSASVYPRNDLNDNPCGLVKVQLATMGASFEGNVIGDAAFKQGEYWVYMSAGSYMLNVKHSNFVPLFVNFRDYGIRKVEGKCVYVLTLSMPQGATPIQKQKLIVNYSPASAIVMIDSKPYQGNGRVEVELPVGSHDYQVIAIGYTTAEGSVKLSADNPRIINETLIVNDTELVQQAQVVQQQPIQQEAAPTQTTNNQDIETFTVNGVSFNMVCVEGGTFMMGATSEQESDAYKDERPAHQVTLSTYSIGETEVTQALWEAVMGNNPLKRKGSDLPVGNVSWKDCQKFVEKLNQLTGKRFRLPTEAEWEYAARGGNKSRGYKYSGSNTIDDVGWYDENCSRQAHPVKTKQANELGLYDMSGNVFEWCQDRYGSYSSNAQTNPTGRPSGGRRVYRGGSWFNKARYCRSSFRVGTASYRFEEIGLRLAL